MYGCYTRQQYAAEPRTDRLKHLHETVFRPVTLHNIPAILLWGRTLGPSVTGGGLGIAHSPAYHTAVQKCLQTRMMSATWARTKPQYPLPSDRCLKESRDC